MALALISLVGVYLLVLILKKSAKFSIFDGFFFVTSPFVFIILINNLFFHKKGFILIPENIVYFHTIFVATFGIGSLIVDAFRQNISTTSLLSRMDSDDVPVKGVCIFACVCIAFIMFDMLMRIRSYGLANVLATVEGTEQGSLAAHLTLLLTPLSVLLFDFFCEYKKKSCLILMLLALACIFTTFIKYHIISAVLTIAVYTIIRRPKLIKRVIIIAGVSIVLFFVLNYAIGFAVRDMEVSGSFYLDHLWKYLVGGTVNIDNVQNYVEQNNVDVSFGKWFLSMLTTFPDMFSLKFLGKEICDYQFSTILPNFPINMAEEQSNVISFLGAVYIHTGLFGFIVYSLIWGCLVQGVYSIAKNSRSLASVLPASVFLTYNTLSFFSSFWELSNPAETILLSFLLFFFVPRKKGKKMCKLRGNKNVF